MSARAPDLERGISRDPRKFPAPRDSTDTMELERVHAISDDGAFASRRFFTGILNALVLSIFAWGAIGAAVFAAWRFLM